MKQLFLMAAIAVGAAGCADELRPIQIGNPLPLSKECEPEGNVSRYAGDLDVTWLDHGFTPSDLSYVLGFTIASNLEGGDVEVGDNPVAGASRNNFIVEQIEFRYDSVPTATYGAEKVPAFFVIAPGVEDAKMIINLVTPKALEKAAALVDSTGGAVTLNAHFRLKGKLASGTVAESNEVSFPITISKRYASFEGCNSELGEVPQFSGPCQGLGGQDGAPVACEVPSNQQ
jgi:hypothetical protein